MYQMIMNWYAFFANWHSKEKNIIKTKKKSFDERAWFNGFKNSK